MAIYGYSISWQNVRIQALIELLGTFLMSQIVRRQFNISSLNPRSQDGNANNCWVRQEFSLHVFHTVKLHPFRHNGA